MCLQLTVRLTEEDATRAWEIAQSATAIAGLHVTPWHGTRDLNISETPGGCGCSLLSDDANWDALSWSMRPEVLPGLVATLAAIRQQTTEGFAFDALWAGEDAFHEAQVFLEDMRSTVERGQISTDSRYLVT